MNHETKHSNMGYLYILICCITSASSFIFIVHLNSISNVMLNIFLTFSLAIILFTAINFKKIPEMLQLIKNNTKPLFYLNVATLFSWIGTFIALKYLDPATKLSIGFGLIAITNFFIFTPINKIKQNKHLLLCVLFILVNMGLVILQHLHTIPNSSLHGVYIGIGCSVVGGIVGGFVGVNAERIGKAGFSSTQILATRFYLLVFVCAILLPFTYHPVATSHIHWGYYMLSTLLVVFLPLLLYHVAIKSIGALIVSFIEPFIPVISYFLQILILGYRFNMLTLTLLSVASFAILWLIRVEHKTKTSGDTPEHQDPVMA